ncbi:MAG: alanine racemase [Candidatus Liptonbacteria bacterium]|nr:alanine racemase [Candidatus Liptonbacteria bacterium]
MSQSIFLQKAKVPIYSYYIPHSIFFMFDEQTEKFYAGLLKEHGSPLFLINEKKLKESYENLSAALKEYYPKNLIAYSYKTNYLPAICETLSKFGARAEIVSGFEYDIAKKIGTEGKNIIWNGPHKTDEDLKNALREKCRLNIDNKEELGRLEKIAKEMGTVVNIGLRVYSESNARIFQTWSRFGFCIEDHEAESVVRMTLRELPHLKICGLHTHLGTNISHPEIYRSVIQKLGQFNASVIRKNNISLQYIDIGGGFPLPSNKPRYLGEWGVPPIGDYVKNIADALSAYFKDELPLLIIEPGRYLVGDAVKLFATIISQKIKGGEQWVVVNSSISALPRAEYIDYPVAVSQKQKSDAGGKINTVIFGLSCMPNDILGRAQLPALREGDVVEISGVGAYSITSSSQWIALRPAVVFVKENEETKPISEREAAKDVIFLK